MANESHLDVGEVMGIFKKPKKELSIITPPKIKPIDDQLGILGSGISSRNLLISYNHG